MKYQIFKQKFSEMEGLNLRIREAKQGFLFYAFSTLLIALQFGLYITDSSILGLMDLEGWLFFITSCISHAAMFALIPYLLSLIFTFCRCNKTARIVQIVGIILLCIINYLNSQVYAIYHFHINGFVLSMVFGEGAGEIFNFDIMLYLKEIALFLVVAAIVIGVWYASYLLWKKRQKAYAWTIAGCIIGCTLFAHLCHIYGAFYQQPSVMKSSALLPYYFPTTSNGLLLKLGCTPPRESMIQMNGKQSADIQYPIQPLQKERMNPDSLPNIIFILIDSWNTRSLTAECMPNAYQFTAKPMVQQSRERQQWNPKRRVQPILRIIVLLLGEFRPCSYPTALHQAPAGTGIRDTDLSECHLCRPTIRQSHLWRGARHPYRDERQYSAGARYKDSRGIHQRFSAA